MKINNKKMERLTVEQYIHLNKEMWEKTVDALYIYVNRESLKQIVRNLCIESDKEVFEPIKEMSGFIPAIKELSRESFIEK